MKILCIRTDKPEAELYLFNDHVEVRKIIWVAHRQLSVTIHNKIDEILRSESFKAKDLDGIVIYKGPGSFTGLRIGFSVANTMANTYKIPIVASGDSDWIDKGIHNLSSGDSDKIAQPEYGAPATITTPKK